MQRDNRLQQISLNDPFFALNELLTAWRNRGKALLLLFPFLSRELNFALYSEEITLLEAFTILTHHHHHHHINGLRSCSPTVQSLDLYDGARNLNEVVWTPVTLRCCSGFPVIGVVPLASDGAIHA